MSTAFYSINTETNALTHVPRKPMDSLGFSEPYHLEEWLSTLGQGLFDRQILWLARQDRPSSDQRSDLIGVDQLGNLLIAELKRGTLDEHAVTQALSYAAEYAGRTADELVELYFEHGRKEGATKLVSATSSLEEAQKRLSEHVGSETEVNESQILLLVGEDFAPRALAVCDYMNAAIEQATFSVECWRYGVHEATDGSLYLMLEQLLPPPSVRQAIEEKREAAKSGKYLRDPERIKFMYAFMAFLAEKEVQATRNPGESYSCRINRLEQTLTFSVRGPHPQLVVPAALSLKGNPQQYGVGVKEAGDTKSLEFLRITMGRDNFTSAIGDEILSALLALEQGQASAGGDTDDGVSSSQKASDG